MYWMSARTDGRTDGSKTAYSPQTSFWLFGDQKGLQINCQSSVHHVKKICITQYTCYQTPVPLSWLTGHWFLAMSWSKFNLGGWNFQCWYLSDIKKDSPIQNLIACLHVLIIFIFGRRVFIFMWARRSYNYCYFYHHLQWLKPIHVYN